MEVTRMRLLRYDGYDVTWFARPPSPAIRRNVASKSKSIRPLLILTSHLMRTAERIHAQTGSNSTSTNQSIRMRQPAVRTHMHVHERNGRRTGAPWTRGHVFGEAQRPPDPTPAACGGADVHALPGDILVDVLRRLRAHSLARCRCVCALWRALVDGRGLLLPHALPPRAFPGFFANARVKPGFLPPPAWRAPAPDRLAFLRPNLPCGGGGGGGGEVAVQDQCNGLVLCFAQDCLAGVPGAGFVCNPATERWARLPPPPTWWPRGHEGLFLAFDPAVSLEYEVFLLPVPPPRQSNSDAEAPRHQGRVTLGMFVPESFGKQQATSEEKLLPLLVFSSAARQWTKRLLAPGRCAPARLYDRVMRRRGRRSAAEGHPSWVRTWRSAVYCRGGSLYAHCEKRVLVVLRCAEGTYDMVKLPAADAGQGGERYAAGHVLSSLPVDAIFPSTEDGVLLRYASVYVSRVKVWSLHESAVGQLEWTLTHDKDLAAQARMLDLLHHAPVAPSNCFPLATEEETSGKCVWFSDEDGEQAGNGCSRRWWNWDDASLLDLHVGEDELLVDVRAGAPPPSFTVLGCHPEREVIFLAAGAFHVVAYHLGSGKV